jgi:hypothetical protein
MGPLWVMGVYGPKWAHVGQCGPCKPIQAHMAHEAPVGTQAWAHGGPKLRPIKGTLGAQAAAAAAKAAAAAA